MKRFEFSLEQLLKVKRQRERLAEMDQMRARLALQEAEAKVADLRAYLARVADDLSARVGHALAPGQWAAGFDLSERIAGQIQAAELARDQATERVREAAEERARIATEVEALATLRQQQWDQWKVQARQADQERLDELSMRQWRAGRNEAA